MVEVSGFIHQFDVAEAEEEANDGTGKWKSPRKPWP